MNKLLPILIALAFPLVHAFAAPSILFDKTSVSVPQNTTFSVVLNINVDNNPAQSSLAIIQYAPADLDVMSVDYGTFFPKVPTDPLKLNDSGNGLLDINGWTESIGGFSGSGRFATITFRAKKATGSSSITLRCDGTNKYSNILDTVNTNILACAQTNSLGVTYTAAGSEGTPTPTPTPTQSTNTYPVCANIAATVTSATGTPLAVTFTCSGVDTDGYINAAYFDFGDGTHDTITKNVGSPGAISTTHTYTTIGSLGASCKVQDNNQVWSQVPDVCKKIIYIKPRPKADQPLAGKTTPLPTTTPTVITLVEVAPTATPSPQLTPEPTEIPEKISSPISNWLVGSGILILVGGIIYLFSRRKRNILPPTEY